MPATPSAEVSLQVAANSAAAQLEMFTRKFKQMQKEMAESTKKTAQEAKQTGTGFASWSSDIVKASVAIYAMHAPMKALHAAAGMISEEIENTIRVSERFKNRQVPYQQQLMNMVFNMPANEDAAKLKESIHKMVMDSKVSDKVGLLRIVESAASSTVDMPYEKRAQVAIEVAETRPDLMGMDQASLEQLTKSVVYNQKVFEDLGSTALSQQGMLQAAKSAALIQSNEAYFKHLGMLPGQIRSSFGKQYGQIETLLFLSALNIASGDTEGPMTATQANNFYGDLKTKFSGVPEMWDKSLIEQRNFLRSNDPRAERLRGELLASLEERSLEGLSEEDRLTMELANLGDPEAIRKQADRPDLTGRAKTRYSLAAFIQPEGAGDDGGVFSINTVFDALLKGSGPDGGEIPIVLDAQGRIDDAASYAKAEKLLKERVAIAKNSKEFATLNLSDATESASENLAQNDTAKALFGMRDKFTQAMLDAGGSAFYYKNESLGGWLSLHRWNEAYLDKNDPNAVADFYLDNIRSQIKAEFAKRRDEVKAVYPDRIAKSKYQTLFGGPNQYFERFDYDRLFQETRVDRAFEVLREGKGSLPKEYQQLYGLSDKSAKDLKTLFELYEDIERMKKTLPGSGAAPAGNSAIPQVQLDQQSMTAVRQVFESVSMLLGFLGPALKGDKPLAVKDANKPRKEPAKGDWGP